MDPYLEDPAFWSDFHPTFLVCWRKALARHLPQPYEARLNERVRLVQMSEEVIQLIYPDVAVVERPMPRRKPPEALGSTLLLEPVAVPHEFLEEVKDTHIEIRHRPDYSLVAVLELLSPWNKTGDGFAEYRGKRQAILQQAVHLVELDLLLAGNRLPMQAPLPAGDYYACVTRAEKRSTGEVYAWTLRQRLPVLPIPLRTPDPDVLIDLQSVFQAAFELGDYDESLRYGKALKAPLPEEDKNWVTDVTSQRNDT
jgi:hypothetical protein